MPTTEQWQQEIISLSPSATEIRSMHEDLTEAEEVQDYLHTCARLHVRSIPRNAIAESNGMCL